MKLVLGAMLLLCFGATTSAGDNVAEQVARDFLRVDKVILEGWSDKSYFFVTEWEYAEEDTAKDFPCQRGVVIDGVSGKPVAPESDPTVVLHFPYTDTMIDGLNVKLCAD